MKKLRIAYDVTFPAAYFGRKESVTGVGRVIESVGRELLAMDEIELVFTGSYGGDPRPAYTSATARRYGGQFPGVPFLESVRSRTGLFPALGPALLKANSWDNVSSPVPLRFLRKGLNGFARWDTAPSLPAGSCDVFHATFYPAPAESFAGPRVMTIYDLFPLQEPEDSVVYQVMRETLSRMDRKNTWAACVSEYTRQQLLAATDLPEDHVTVFPLAAESVFQPSRDPAIFAEIKQSYALPDAPYLLTVGNPQPRKNIPLLIRAFQKLAQEPGELAHLVIAGSKQLGWGHEEIDRQLAAEPAVRDRIHFIGQAPDEELAVIYSHCTAFVFPSRYEGFGLPPLEAMQCGAPVICSTATSLPEVVGDAALPIPADDEIALIDAMRALLHSEDMRADYAARGLKRARGFSWRRAAEATLATYLAAAKNIPQ